MIVLKAQAFAARDLTTANGITILTSDAMPGSPAIHNVGAVIRIGSGEGGANDLHADARILSLWLLLDGVPASRFDFTPRLDTPEVQDVISMPPFPVLAGQVATLKLFSSNANDTAVKVAADLGSHDLDYLFAFRAAEGSPTADSPIERLKALDDGTAVVSADVVQINSSALAAQVLAAEKYEYKDDAVVVVADGATDAARGVNLAAAYTAAKALTPGGNALSATNRAAVLIPPGRYSIAATLVLDGEFVDFVGFGSQPEDTEVYADIMNPTARQTAADLRMRNFVIRGLDTFGWGSRRDLEIDVPAPGNGNSIYEDMRFRHGADVTGVYGISDIHGTWRRCKADAWSWVVAANKVLAATMFDCEAGDKSFGGDAAGAAITGCLERCRGGDESFGGCTWFGCNISGTLVDCVAGDRSFALGKTFSGVAIRCRGGDDSFSSTTRDADPGEFSGYAEGCVGGKESFGGRAAGVGAFGKCTGTLVRCISRGSELPTRLEGATIEGCLLTMGTVDEDGVLLLDSASRIHHSTILVVEGGTGIPINAASALSVSAAGNRFNNRGVSETGLGPNVTNVGAGEPAAILADTADIQPRLTGITSLAAWIRGLFRKSAMDATAKTEVNTGGGTYNEATDSQEALRDTAPMGTAMRGTDSAALATVCTEDRLARLDATVGSRATQTSVDALPASIWNRLTGLLATAGSVGAFLLARLNAIKAKTDTIGAADLTAVSPVLEDGDLEIVQGDDYMEADGRALEWTDTAYTGPIQDGDDAEFALMETADYHAAGGAPALTKAGTAHLVGTTLRIVVELTAAETAALEPSPPDDRMNYTYQVRVDVGSSGSGERRVTAALGAATVKKKVVA